MSSQEKNLSITPETKIGQLLAHYPQLEDVLIEIAPAFNKLKNPLLRKTVAKVTTLRQAAKIGNVSLSTMINRLRIEAGIKSDENFNEHKAADSSAKPDWFDDSKIALCLDARPMLEAGEQPMSRVMNDLKKLSKGQIYELITPFDPAPLKDMAQGKGYQTWLEEVELELVKTYFIQL